MTKYRDLMEPFHNKSEQNAKLRDKVLSRK